MTKPFIVLLLAGVGALSAQERSLPVENEPQHKTVLQNQYIRVYHVTLQPGQSTGMHTHSHDDVAVRLSDSRITVDEPGKATSMPSDERQGGVSARTLTGHPFTHKVNNVGKTPFDVLDVEIINRAEGHGRKALGMIAAENPSARAYRYKLEAGGSSPEHTHERPYLIVAATDMNLKMTSPDGQSRTEEVKAADLHWVDRKVTHTLTNSGSQPGILVEIELK